MLFPLPTIKCLSLLPGLSTFIYSSITSRQVLCSQSGPALQKAGNLRPVCLLLSCASYHLTRYNTMLTTRICTTYFKIKVCVDYNRRVLDLQLDLLDHTQLQCIHFITHNNRIQLCNHCCNQLLWRPFPSHTAAAPLSNTNYLTNFLTNYHWL
jgi:hypothetical protein